MKKIIIVLCVLTYTTVFSQQSAKYIDADALFEQAGQLFQNGETEQSLELLNQINENDSVYLASLELMTNIYIAEEKYDKAVEICNQHLEPESDYFFDFAFNKGLALIRAKKFQEAADVYNWLINYYPKHHIIIYNLGIAYEQLEQYEKAIKYYQESITYHAYYAPPHLALGNLCYNEGKLGQALLCWNNYLMLNPNGSNSLNVLVMANSAMALNLEQEPKGIKISEDDDSFKQIDLMLDNKIALDKGYKIPNKIDAAFVKQNYALVELLKSYKGNGGFWSERYVPMYLKIKENSQFENYIYRTLASTTHTKYQKIINKGVKNMDEFIEWYANEWQSLIGENNIPGEPDTWYYYESSGNLTSIGNKKNQEGLNGKYTFYTNGRILSKGEYTNNQRSGHWTWFYEWGPKQEEVTYGNDGKPSGDYIKYYPNGNLKSRVKLEGDNYQGEYKAYSEQGFLEEHSNFLDDKYDGIRKLYHPLGEEFLRLEIPFKEGLTQGKVKRYFTNGNIDMEVEFQDDKRVKEEKQYFRNGNISYVYTYSDGLLTGPYKSYYIDGNIHTEGMYQDDKPHGKWTYYFKTGSKSEERNYAEGELNGDKINYDYNGEIIYRAIYANGEITTYSFFNRNGQLIEKADKLAKNHKYTNYYGNGNIRSKGTMNSNQENNGNWEYYSVYGALASKETYNKGEITGPDSAYFTNGALQSITYYKEGEAQGLHTTFYIDGTIEEEGYYIDGEMDRIWKSYYPDGTLYTISYYNNGDQQGYQYAYTVDGKLYARSYVMNDLMHNTVFYDTLGNVNDTIDFFTEKEHKQYFANGKLKQQYELVNGYRHGKFRSYYANGKLNAEGEYLMGDQVGKWVWFDDKGQITQEGTYEDGQQHGIWTSYHTNGKKNNVRNFNYGTLEGKYTTYSETGSITYEAAYFNGNLNGDIKYYSPNGDLQMERYYLHGELTGYSYLGDDGKLLPVIPIKSGTVKATTYFSNGNKAREFEMKHGDFTGTYYAYYKNGKIEAETDYVAGYRNGVEINYYSNGQIKEKSFNKSNALHGLSLKYYENGQVKEQVNYKNDEPVGKGLFYNPDGSLYKEEVYFNGEVYDATYY